VTNEVLDTCAHFYCLNTHLFLWHLGTRRCSKLPDPGSFDDYFLLLSLSFCFGPFCVGLELSMSAEVI